jgi:hypothetical protein
MSERFFIHERHRARLTVNQTKDALEALGMGYKEVTWEEHQAFDLRPDVLRNFDPKVEKAKEP